MHGQRHLAAGADDGVGARHERVLQHRQQIGEVDPLRVGEADHQHALVGARHVARNERVGRVHRRHALEVDMRARKLRADVVHVVGHAPQDHVGHRLGGVAAERAVPVQLLDPFEVDHRHDAKIEQPVEGRGGIEITAAILEIVERDEHLRRGQSLRAEQFFPDMRQGDLADTAYVVRSGTLEVLRSGKPVGTLSPGDFFGEVALMKGTRRTATVRCLTTCELTVFAKEDFDAAESSA